MADATISALSQPKPLSLLQRHPWIVYIGLFLFVVAPGIGTLVSHNNHERWVNFIAAPYNDAFTIAYLLWLVFLKDHYERQPKLRTRNRLPTFLLCLFFPILAHRMGRTDIIELIRWRLVLSAIGLISALLTMVG